MWSLTKDSTIRPFEPIHDHFLSRQIGAITYRPSKALLLSAGKGRLYMTDMQTMRDVGKMDFIQFVQMLSLFG